MVRMARMAMVANADAGDGQDALDGQLVDQHRRPADGCEEERGRAQDGPRGVQRGTGSASRESRREKLPGHGQP